MKAVNAMYNKQPEALAYQGESNWEPVRISVAELLEKHTGGTVTLFVLRPEDREAYIPENVELDGTVLVWTPTAYDTQNLGIIEAQGVYAAGGNVIGKTEIHEYTINRSLEAGEEEPPEFGTWVDELLAAAGEVSSEISAAEQTLNDAVSAAQLAQSKAEEAKTAAETAQDKAEEAETGAENAQGLAETAQGSAEEARDDAEAFSLASEAWAVGTRDGVAIPQDDPAYNNNAKHYAEVAQQGADEHGYVWFDVRDSDGKMYVTITENLEEDVEFSVNETTGTLEVVVNG